MGAVCTPGSRVGAGRWPGIGGHTDAWGTPWTGVVLPQWDVRAWTDTLAFAGRPTQRAVDAHVAACHSQGLLRHEVPVLWEFGRHSVVYWQPCSGLVPAERDLHMWRAARERERAHEAMRAAVRQAPSAAVLAPA